MFNNFRTFSVDVGDVIISGRAGGHGPPLLLLHGFPQTHAMWHRVAPLLAQDFTVVAPDLRGYGASGKPVTTPGDATYSKRRMADDQRQLMQKLGYDRFSVAGHDRGGRCAYRLALDHPGVVRRVAVLDIVPTLDALAEVTTAEAAMDLWRWFFLAQPHPVPETIISAAPDEFFFGQHRDVFAPEALDSYQKAVREPSAIRAMCDDYRAMVTQDADHDRCDAGVRLITAPLLALWGLRSHVHKWHDVSAVWGRWSTDVTAHALDCGHFLAEERPQETYERLHAFFV